MSISYFFFSSIRGNDYLFIDGYVSKTDEFEEEPPAIYISSLNLIISVRLIAIDYEI